MARRLNQIVAVEKGVKTRSQKVVDVLYKTLQKPALFDGFTKTYQKKHEEGEDVPPQSQRIQCKVDQSMAEMKQALSELIDVTATKDTANRTAKADVLVDGGLVLSRVPVTFLLFIEKRLTDLHAFVGSIPTLDPAEEWAWAGPRGFYATPAIKTARTKKVQKALSLAKATDKHAEQAVMITEDEYVGDWHMVKHSAAWPESQKRKRLAKIEKLQRAVKYAREEANSVEISDVVGTAEKIFTYLDED